MQEPDNDIIFLKLQSGKSLKASYFSILNEVSEHDYSPTLPVIEDLQHVPSSGCHGPLGYDECLLLLVTLSIMIKERLA